MTFAAARLAWDPTLERLIAGVRLALAAFALFVVWLDPTQPSKHVAVAYGAFVAYLAYSAVVFLLVRARSRSVLLLATQVIDLLFIPPVLLFTEAGNTPFFPFFVVMMLTAGIRWGIWASWAVTGYSVVMYGVLLFVEPPTPLDLNNDLMQLAYFLIVGILGGYLAEYRRRREAELVTLRATAEAIATKYTAADAMAAVVDAAKAHGLADTVLGLLRAPEDDDLLIVRGAGDVKRLSAEEAAPFLAAAEGLAGQKGRGIRLTERDDVILRYAGAVRGAAHPIRAGADLVGAMFLFYAAEREAPRDEFSHLLLRHVLPQIETLYVLEQAPRTRVMEERRRIARDLHDSVIQVLAALGLRLDAVGVAAADRLGERERGELAQIRDIIGHEQRRVRAYIAEMREPLTGALALPEVIEQISETFRARTHVAVTLALGGGELGAVPADVVRELTPLLSEALTNVEKHAQASHVRIAADVGPDGLVIVVTDDGRGIDPRVLARTASDGRGLSSMRERAQVLGGALTIESASAPGTTITIRIPLPVLV